MDCKITINMDNDAFEEFPQLELSRCLSDVINKINWINIEEIREEISIIIKDINGNKIGKCIITK